MKRILYIEDDDVDRKALFKALCGKEYHVELASSFSEGYDLMKANKYDLVISDQQVGPDNLAEEIQYFEGQNLIVLTNNKGSLKLPGLEVFEKPFSKTMLQGRVEEDTPQKEGLHKLEELCGEDSEALTEMLVLIKSDLEETLELLPEVVAENAYEKQANIIHKVLSKIGILGMKKEHGILFAFENRLRKNDALVSSEHEEVNKILHKALFLVK